MTSVTRFQVCLVSLNPTNGKEINKTRPCVVISPNEMAALSTVLVAPMTTKGFDFPCRIQVQI
jgi:mRNA interferase MazF